MAHDGRHTEDCRISEQSSRGETLDDLLPEAFCG